VPSPFRCFLPPSPPGAPAVLFFFISSRPRIDFPASFHPMVPGTGLLTPLFSSRSLRSPRSTFFISGVRCPCARAHPLRRDKSNLPLSPVFFSQQGPESTSSYLIPCAEIEKFNDAGVRHCPQRSVEAGAARLFFSTFPGDTTLSIGMTTIPMTPFHLMLGDLELFCNLYPSSFFDLFAQMAVRFFRRSTD